MNVTTTHFHKSSVICLHLMKIPPDFIFVIGNFIRLICPKVKSARQIISDNSCFKTNVLSFSLGMSNMCYPPNSKVYKSYLSNRVSDGSLSMHFINTLFYLS
ncbi:unnamed protein product [Schistosoma bovis]|nr:unnamed protein product [Schistosoma bovis]